MSSKLLEDAHETPGPMNMVMNTSAIDVAIASRDTDAAVVVPRTLAEANKTLGSAPYVEDSEVQKTLKN
jgi:hypothetical protein